MLLPNLLLPELHPNKIWRVRLRDLPRGRRTIVRLARIFMVAVREFNTDKCFLRASALTFFTLMSVVPILAMSFGIAKGFGIEKQLEERIRLAFAGQEEVIERSIEFSRSMLANAQGGLIAGIGLVVLIWTVVKVLGHIEESFNAIWRVTRGRTLLRKFSDYLSIVFLSPILILLSSSITVFIQSQVTSILERLSFLGFMAPLIYSALKLTPFILTWALFTFIYSFIPNTRINLTSALFAGIIAGTAYQTTQILYIALQIGVSSASAIYGSFAALPLFLTWLQVSWIIVLFGAELSFAYQKIDDYEWGEDASKASALFRRKVMIAMTRDAVQAFRDDRPAPNFKDFVERLSLPPRFVRDCLDRLVAARVLSELHVPGSPEPAFQPAVDPAKLTIAEVLRRIDSHGGVDLPLDPRAGMPAIAECVEELRLAMAGTAANRLVGDLPPGDV